MMDIVYLGPDSQEITIVASKFAVVSFLVPSMLFQRNNFEFRGEKNNNPSSFSGS